MILQLGKQKRIDRIIGKNGKTFIVPVDDLLISGPDNQLIQYKEKIAYDEPKTSEYYHRTKLLISNKKS